MGDFVRNLFSAEFMPHGHCFYWKPEILWLHVGSDALIALSYFSIPATILYFAKRRTDLVFPQVFFLFSAFIFACGTTHLIGIWTMWNPMYRVEGLVKLLTGLVSAATALMLIPVVPRALALRSPLELQRTNRQLHDEIELRTSIEAELLRERDHVRMLLELAPVPVIETDRSGVIVRANRYAESLAGTAPNGLAGVMFTSHFSAPDGSVLDPMGSEAVTTHLPDGERVIDWRNRPLEETDDGSAPRLWVGLDVTDRINAERLHLEKERVATAGRLRRQFLGNISHELRDPIDIVFGYAEVLADTELSPGQRELVGKMVRAKRRVTRLVDDLLDLSKIEIGQLAIMPRAVDGIAALRSAVDRMHSLGATTSHRVELELTDASARIIRADPERLEQVFANLIENAQRLGAGAPIRVGAEVVTSADGVAEWCVAVRHSGPGISAARLAEVLEDLAPLQSGRTRPEGGGLGLAISKQLVDRMGGRIWIEEDHGSGGTLFVAFPIDRV